MEKRYLRNIPALSEAECALLRTKRVLIVGCGGLGGHLLDQMLRMGVGAIRVCDGDVFDETNLNRQLLCRVDRLGQSKAKAALEHAALVNPQAALEVYDGPMNEDNVLDLVQGCDAVLDGLDNVASRRILAKACARQSIPYFYGAIDGWIAQAAVILPGDRLLEKLYPTEEAPKAPSALAFTPALCAAVQASLCTRLLTGQPIEHGILYHFDLLHMDLDTIAIK